MSSPGYPSGPPPIPQMPVSRPRRRSLITPLILIAIGVLFLARNLLPEFRLLDYVAQYWPFLLIGWGTLRAIEIFSWSVSGARLPRFGMSGGEWLLVILVCMVGFAVHAARGFYTNWLPGTPFELGGVEIFGQPYDYPVSAEREVGPAPRIFLEGLAGSVRISGSDENRVVVGGRNVVRSMDPSDAADTNEKVELDIDGEGEEVTIRANYGSVRTRGMIDRRVSGDLTISVPRGASIISRDGRVDFDINDISGDVEIHSRNNSVRLEDIGGDVRLDLDNMDLTRAYNVGGNFTLSGSGDDIDLENIAGRVDVDGSFSGVQQLRSIGQELNWDGLQTDINAEAVPGTLRLTIADLEASGLAGEVRITSTTKDVWLSNFTGPLELDLDRGDVLLAPGELLLGHIQVNLNSGNVELGLPDGFAGNLTAITNRGKATNSYGAPIAESPGTRRGSGSLESEGPGEPVTIRMDRGDIVVRRGSETNFAFPEAVETPARLTGGAKDLEVIQQ